MNCSITQHVHSQNETSNNNAVKMIILPKVSTHAVRNVQNIIDTDDLKNSNDTTTYASTKVKQRLLNEYENRKDNANFLWEEFQSWSCTLELRSQKTLQQMSNSFPIQLRIAMTVSLYEDTFAVTAAQQYAIKYPWQLTWKFSQEFTRKPARLLKVALWSKSVYKR